MIGVTDVVITVSVDLDILKSMVIFRGNFIRQTVKLVLILSLGMAWANGLYARYVDLPSNPIELELLDLTNAERTQAGVTALQFDARLAQAARHHAKEMAELNYMSHESPFAERRTVIERVVQAGSAAQSVGENIAQIPTRNNHYDLAKTTVGGWVGSPGHRHNLLHTDFTHVGFGVAYSDTGFAYVVQVLGEQWLTLTYAHLITDFTEQYQITLQLDVLTPSHIAVFYANHHTKGKIYPVGQHTLTLTVDSRQAPEVMNISIGALPPNHARGQEFILQDDGWVRFAQVPYDAWQGGISGPQTYARIADVKIKRERAQVYRADLQFNTAPQQAYGVWLNETFMQSARFRDKTLSITVPADEALHSLIELGLEDGINHYALVSRFELVKDKAGNMVLAPASRN